MSIGHTSVSIIIRVQALNIKKHLDRLFQIFIRASNGPSRTLTATRMKCMHKHPSNRILINSCSESFVALFRNRNFPYRIDDEYKFLIQIHIDIPRMTPLLSIFQQVVVQELFERILFIWAIRHPASGYVQGINDLVTPFFVVFLSEFIDNGKRNRIF